MDTDLHHKHCVPCEGGVEPLSPADISHFLKNIKGWSVLEDQKIHKKYHFLDFKRAMSFAHEVADVAEFENHHPDIYIHDWNKVTITFSTHAIKGLSENDFIMAAKIDQIIKDATEII